MPQPEVYEVFPWSRTRYFILAFNASEYMRGVNFNASFAINKLRIYACPSIQQIWAAVNYASLVTPVKYASLVTPRSTRPVHTISKMRERARSSCTSGVLLQHWMLHRMHSVQYLTSYSKSTVILDLMCYGALNASITLVIYRRFSCQGGWWRILSSILSRSKDLQIRILYMTFFIII